MEGGLYRRLWRKIGCKEQRGVQRGRLGSMEKCRPPVVKNGLCRRHSWAFRGEQWLHWGHQYSGAQAYAGDWGVQERKCCIEDWSDNGMYRGTEDGYIGIMGHIQRSW